MKKNSIFSVCLALLALGLVLLSCSNGSTSNDAVDAPLLFYGTSGGEAVTIKISQTDPSKAVLTPKDGDFYEIKWDNEVVSWGKIAVTNYTWSFTPSSGSPGTKTPFNATYNKDKKTLFFSSIPGTGISNLTVSVIGNNNTTGNDDDGDSNGNSKGNGTGNNGTTSTNDVTWTAAADGTSGSITSTKIDFTFSQNVTGLTAGDITITNDTGSVSKGSLSGSGKTWSLGITVNTPGNVKVKISLSGVSTTEKTIAVYKNTGTPTLSNLDIYIDRADFDDATFVFTVAPVAGADSYKAFFGATELGSSATTTVSVPGGATLDAVALSPFFAQAFAGAEDASNRTTVPGILKSTRLDAVIDWLTFLDNALDILADNPATNAAFLPHGPLGSTIKLVTLPNLLVPGQTDADADAAVAVLTEVDLISATEAILDNYDDIWDHLKYNVAPASLQMAYMTTINQTMLRVWVNELTKPDVGVDAKLTARVYDEYFDSYPEVKGIN